MAVIPWGVMGFLIVWTGRGAWSQERGVAGGGGRCTGMLVFWLQLILPSSQLS